MMMSKIYDYLGNTNLLNLSKTAFLCSSKYSSKAVLKSYDWAREQRNSNRCVISGFHSPLEKDVLEILLKGNSPIIYVLARGMLKRIPYNLSESVETGRLLILTSFDKSITWVTKENAEIRNQMCALLADDITVAHINPGGILEKLLMPYHNAKEITILDANKDETKHLGAMHELKYTK